jgi:3-methyladenine DNA glycosylase/8-oxoguanine DNA glycosylase
MVQLAERWRPYRSLAVSYLFASEMLFSGSKGAAHAARSSLAREVAAGGG